MSNAAKFKVGDRVFVDGEGFEGEILVAYADGTFLVEMSVVDDDGETYCLKCVADELEPVAPSAPAADIAELQRKLDAALTALAPFADAWKAYSKDDYLVRASSDDNYGVQFEDWYNNTVDWELVEANYERAADTLAALREAQS